MNDSQDTAFDRGGTRGANLMQHHVRMLRESAISDAVRDARGYRSVSRPSNADQRPRDLLRRLGIPRWARDEDTRFPGLLIPQYRVTGELISWQYRPDKAPPDPDKPGKHRKYANQSGRPAVLDLHPSNKDRIIDPTVQLYITEGTRKADALTSLGFCTIALAGVYNWRHHLATLGDWEDVPLMGRHVIIVYDSDARDNDGIKQAMVRLGRWLTSKGAARVSYVITPPIAGQDKTGVDDFLAAGGTLDQLWAAGTDSPPKPDKGPGLDPEGLMVEDLVTEALDGKWLWSPALGWLRYEPGTGRWKPQGQDRDAAISEVVRGWLKGKGAEAAQAFAAATYQGAAKNELDRLRALAGLWHAAPTKARITALASLARGLMMRDAEDFDAHPDLINCQNAVLDLRTGETMPHDPDLLFTQVTAARYVPGAAHPDWDKALEAIPEEVRGYVQLRYGQAATGHTPPDEVVLVQLGDGENGKSTIVYACQGALGAYFQKISDRAIVRDKSQHPTEQMGFRGARLAVMEELAEDRVLNMRTIKDVTGPEIKARYCGQDEVTYSTSHALVISTNYDPLITETDHGSWRRLMALRFPYWYHKPGKMPEPPGPLDRAGQLGLREKLRDGHGGRGEAVLAWLAEGARRWYADPDALSKVPEKIEKDTQDWRARCNPVYGWILEELEPSPGHHVPSQELTDSLSRALVLAGHMKMTDRLVSGRIEQAFSSLGWKAAKSQAGAGYNLTVVSRPEGYAPQLTKNYKAWHGIRYKVLSDTGGQGEGEPQSAQSGSLPEKMESTPSRSGPGNPIVPIVPGQRDANGQVNHAGTVPGGPLPLPRPPGPEAWQVTPQVTTRMTTARHGLDRLGQPLPPDCEQCANISGGCYRHHGGQR